MALDVGRVHLHIPGAASAEQKHRPGRCAQRSESGQVAGSRFHWQSAQAGRRRAVEGRLGPQCPGPGGTWIHAGPRVTSRFMALEIGASAALEQPEKPRLARRGPGATGSDSESDTQAGTLRARPGQIEPASGLECTSSVHAGDMNPFINIQSLAVPSSSWKEQLEFATPMCLGSVLE
jgi:hypothetical protein